MIKETTKEGSKVKIREPMQKPLMIIDCTKEEQMMRDEKGDPISSETQNWA
jgi:hypothetical protein